MFAPESFRPCRFVLGRFAPGSFRPQFFYHIVLDYNQNSKRLKITAQNDRQVRLKFPNDFGQILGINPLWSEKSIGNEKDVFTYSVALNGPYDRLYVYSDVAAFTNIGDTQAPILRILPFEPNQTLTNFHMEFRNLHYVPVVKSFIVQIHISLKGDNGEDVPFVTGKTMIKLHFRLKIGEKLWYKKLVIVNYLSFYI